MWRDSTGKGWQHGYIVRDPYSCVLNSTFAKWTCAVSVACGLMLCVTTSLCSEALTEKKKFSPVGVFNLWTPHKQRLKALFWHNTVWIFTHIIEFLHHITFAAFYPQKNWIINAIFICLIEWQHFSLVYRPKPGSVYKYIYVLKSYSLYLCVFTLSDWTSVSAAAWFRTEELGHAHCGHRLDSLMYEIWTLRDKVTYIWLT